MAQLMDTDSLRDLKGSISLRAQETGSGFRFFFDDDEESFFDLNLEKMADSEEFEFQISFSPLPAAGFSAHHPADELVKNGRILPLQGLQVVEARGSLVPRFGEQQVYPAERLLLESSTPDAAAGGGLNQKAQLDPSSEEKHPQGPAETRKTPKAAAAKKTSSGVKKFLIKFPSEKIRAMFISLVRSYHLLSLPTKRGQGEGGTQETGRVYKRLVVHFSRWLALRKRSHNKSSENSSTTDAAPQRPSDVDLDEDVVRSILEAVDFAVGSRNKGAAAASSGRGGPRRSTSSSPRESREQVVEGAVERNSSISSAIAHCKMSYGSTAHLP